MKGRLLICLFLLLSFKGYSQCALNVVLSQPSVAICAGNVATLTANSGDSYIWYNSASGGSIVGTGQIYNTPVLYNSTTYYVVVTANGCTSSPLPVTVNVTPQPQPPTVANATICTGWMVNLHANGSGGIFNWFSTATGGVPLISSPDYTTPPLTVTTTYYVETTANGCESARTPVTVTVNPIPGAPTAQSDTICYGSSASVTASTNPSGIYQWFDALAGGNLLNTGNTYNTPVLNNSTTYYVQASNGECASARTPVNIIVKPQLSPPSVSGAIICYGSATTLTATSQGGTYQWFDAPTGGNVVSTSSTFTTPALTSNTTYYVENTIAGCVSPLAPVTVTVLPPASPPAASSTSVCTGNPALLTATGGNNYSWYDSATGGNLLSQAQTYATPALTNTTTYYVETTVNGCTSSRTPVTVTVNPIPLPPTASGTTICPGTAATLTASATGTVSWYDTATGGNLLSTGTTFNTPVLTKNTTYYIENATGQCSSTRIPVTVSVTSLTDPQYQYPGSTFCIAGPNPTPIINNPSGGVFSAAPAGLVFIDNTTGQINIAASTPGTYTVSFTSSGTCVQTTSSTITITSSPNAQFSYSGPYCQDGVNPLPNFIGNASGGTFSASPAGLVFVNTSTGEINLGASTPGTYTITNNIAPAGGCPSASATATVTIYQQVIVNAGPAQTVNPGSTVQLAGTISGGSTTGTWTGGTGTFSDPTLPNAVYTPGAGETTATLTLTSGDPPGPCGPKSATVIISINANPASPTAPGVSTCYNSSTTLNATAPGGTYEWFDAATGGNLLATGSNFITQVLTVNTTYYVQTTVNGYTSNRTPVVVTVNAIPSSPVVQSTQVCSGTTATITASGSAGTYQWYDSATGGNLLSTNNAYTTPVLTINSIYYVQAVVNGCISPRTADTIVVNPVPIITSAATANICSGNAFSYAITANLPNVTFTWSRAQVAGISNPAAINQTSGTINETLINTGGTSVNVTYAITASNGSCPGPVFYYVVTVYPTPVVTSPPTDTICNFSAVNYNIVLSTPNTYFTWSRAAVPGVSNATVSGQTDGIIQEVLFNTSNAPVNVTYVINSATSTCTGIAFNLVVTVNPNAVITSAASGTTCTGAAQNYEISSNVPSATFLWSRNATNNISNAAISNQTSGTINETLVNTGNTPVLVTYNITPIAYNCTGTPFQYNVVVNPQLVPPVAATNSPVCVGSTIQLTTDSIPNATYLWTGPNGFTSSLQNAVVTNVSAANAGTYNLAIIVNGCTSPTASTVVAVDNPPIATAGPDQYVCAAVPFVSLAGNVSGGTTTGVWTTAGSGTFSPSNTALNAMYIPSSADTSAGAVTLTLSSTSKDNCSISTSIMTIKFGPSPAVIAGPNQTVCAQASGVALNGKVLIAGGGIWSTSGTGTFSPSETQLNASYIPSILDLKKGAVTLTLTATGANACYIATDSLVVKLNPPPVVNAGGLKYILKGGTLTLTPTVNENDLTYLWSPNIDISDVNVKNPVITGDIDRVYTLIVTDSLGCESSSETTIRVGAQIIVDNTFTPNADGINDVWNIAGLTAYQQATVDIFTRYGTKIYHSIGYDKPFDGTYNGQALPVGVYYYIIDTKVHGLILSGYVTIIR